MNLSDKAKKIKAIILDIDGVLTDGRFGYDCTGNEIKFFHSRDGHGIRMAIRAGFLVGFISGRESEVNRRRAQELGMQFIKEKCHDKRVAFAEVCQELNLKAEECLYIGDDVIDAPVMRRVGVAVMVNDGEADLATIADFKTQAKGGHGAVREVINWLLKEQNLWQSAVIERYFEN